MTETSPTPRTGVATDVSQGGRLPVSALVSNLREYGLVLALIAIMVFFQFTTSGTLFKPVNLSNLVQQNSFIIVMALGMLLVIVSGHIDLSVGSVAGFIGAVAANMMVTWQLGIVSNPIVVTSLCLVLGGVIGAAQGYWVAYHRIPSFIVTLAGMLIFRGLCQAMLGGGRQKTLVSKRAQRPIKDHGGLWLREIFAQKQRDIVIGKADLFQFVRNSLDHVGADFCGLARRL